ncbi:MAG: DUF6259 domain-containing protein, partial [Candidatus Nanohaloarchaea archaeon]
GIRHINQDGIPLKDDPCWNDAHDHPPGKGGNWFQQGVQDYLRSIHTRSDDVDVNISGEGIADIYLPEMTIALTRDVRGELRGGESIGAGGS